MNKLLTTALLGVLGVFGASAQNMLVMAPDGTYTKFNTDYVQEVTFVEVGDVETTTFETITATPMSGGYADLAFESEKTKVLLYVCGPKDALWLNPGVYTASPDNSPMTFDTDPNYSYVQIEGEKKTIQAGTMTVSVTGTEYIISLEVILNDGNTFKGLYQGSVPGYGEVMDVPAVNCQYVELNDQKPGEFCLRFSDATWLYEMTIDFFAAADSKVLPAGVYTFANEPAPGNIGPYSNISIYKPNHSSHLKGSVDVQTDGKNYLITCDLFTEQGRPIKVTYNGEIEFPDAE